MSTNVRVSCYRSLELNLTCIREYTRGEIKQFQPFRTERNIRKKIEYFPSCCAWLIAKAHESQLRVKNPVDHRSLNIRHASLTNSTYEKPKNRSAKWISMQKFALDSGSRQYPSESVPTFTGWFRRICHLIDSNSAVKRHRNLHT